MANRQLSTYLNDHLGGSQFGVQLAHTGASRYEGTPLGDTFQELAGEIEEDIGVLRSVMRELGVRRLLYKRAGAGIGELFFRLKSNGAVMGRSGLDPLSDLETLSLGIEGKHVLWISLAASSIEVPGCDFGALAKRAESQRARLESHRPKAAGEALADD